MRAEDEHFLAVATAAAEQARRKLDCLLQSVARHTGLDNSPIFSDFSPKPHKYRSYWAPFIAIAFWEKKLPFEKKVGLEKIEKSQINIFPIKNQLYQIEIKNLLRILDLIDQKYLDKNLKIVVFLWFENSDRNDKSTREQLFKA